MKKTINIFINLILFASLVSAQISITQSTVTSVYAVGNVLESHEDTLITSLNIGSTGNTSWDFSGIASHVVVSNISVEPSSTPWFSEFPTANISLKTQESLFPGTLADLYTYVNVTSADFNFLGAKTEFTFQGMIIQQNLSNNPPEKAFVFPVTFGSEWTTVYSFSGSSTMGGAPLSSYTENHTTHYKCDAYGTAIMPNGQVVQAVRIRQDDRYIDPDDDNYYQRKVSYDIIAENGLSVSFTAVDTLAPDNGIIAVSNVDWLSLGTVDVKPENQPIPSDFTLFQNYPNPFNPSTTIKFSIPSESFVNLTIYDALGKEITTLVNEELPAGTYNATWDASSSNHSLAAGVYFYQLKAGNYSQTKKLLLVK